MTWHAATFFSVASPVLGVFVHIPDLLLCLREQVVDLVLLRLEIRQFRLKIHGWSHAHAQPHQAFHRLQEGRRPPENHNKINHQKCRAILSYPGFFFLSPGYNRKSRKNKTFNLGIKDEEEAKSEISPVLKFVKARISKPKFFLIFLVYFQQS
jgi:hypothetical protein